MKSTSDCSSAAKMPIPRWRCGLGRARFGTRLATHVRTARTTPTQLGHVLSQLRHRVGTNCVHRCFEHIDGGNLYTRTSRSMEQPAICRLDCMDNSIWLRLSPATSCLRVARPQGFQLASRSSARSWATEQRSSSLGLSSRSPAAIQLHRYCRKAQLIAGESSPASITRNSRLSTLPVALRW